MSELKTSVVLACHPRSRDAWLAAASALDVERNHELQPGYLGKGLTWCNEAARRFCELLGVHLPRGLLVNELLPWLDSTAGAAAGWVPCHEAEAVLHAMAGEPVLVGWANPGGHGHIAVVHPDSDSFAVWILQAGRFNSSKCRIEQGFGHLPVKFWRHP